MKIERFKLIKNIVYKNFGLGMKSLKHKYGNNIKKLKF